MEGEFTYSDIFFAGTNFGWALHSAFDILPYKHTACLGFKNVALFVSEFLSVRFTCSNNINGKYLRYHY